MTKAANTFRQDYLAALETLAREVDREIARVKDGEKPTLALSLSTDLVTRIGESLWNEMSEEEV